MENQNNRQGGNNREGNNGGMMDRIADAIENVVDTVTGNDQDNKDQQKGRNNQNNR
jgi:hypothetical protein